MVLSELYNLRGSCSVKVGYVATMTARTEPVAVGITKDRIVEVGIMYLLFVGKGPVEIELMEIDTLATKALETGTAKTGATKEGSLATELRKLKPWRLGPPS